MDQRVVIVGAGPVGLWLAAELRYGGVEVTVLERRTERNANSRALTVHARTLELFDSRGVLDPLLAEGTRIPNGHFAVLDSRLDFRGLDSPHPFTVAIPRSAPSGSWRSTPEGRAPTSAAGSRCPVWSSARTGCAF